MAAVGVVGTTSWATTLAIIMARQGHDLTLWARSEDEASRLRADGENKRFLPGTPFPSSLKVTSSREEAVSGAGLIIIAVPSRSLRSNVRAMRPWLTGPSLVVSAAKGLEMESAKRMTQVLEEELPQQLHSGICCLSGPNLATEIIRGQPSSAVIAARNEETAGSAQTLITSSTFRVYTNTDVVGVELGGALKNIIALGAGICDGLDYGDNAKAAFMTRGLAEITRLGVASGARPMTFAGLAGVGDLMATCSSVLSRNRFVGEQLAKGRALDDIRAGMKNVAEGVDTTAAAVSLAERLGVEMPICQATFDVLFNGKAIDDAVAQLMGRTPVPE